MSENILVVVPTAAEGAHIDTERLCEAFGDKVRVIVGGVGMAAIAASLARLLRDAQPRMVILAGIAGAYPDCGLSAGDVVLVATERIADLGAMRGERFEPLYQQVYHCPHVAAFPALRAVAANTVNCAAAAHSAPSGPLPATSGPVPAELENMEGAAFFAVCIELGVPFLELRAISNVVSDPPAMWNVPLATKNLAAALETLLGRITDQLDV